MKLKKHTSEIALAIKRLFVDRHDSFLCDIKGVVHIGANTGQERKLYAKYQLDVLWVEPIPEVFLELRKNLSGFHRQHAYQYLITDKDNETYTFNVASNNGASSTILEMNLHKDIWPEVCYARTISLKSITLGGLFEKKKIEVPDFDSYAGCCQVQEVESFLKKQGFIQYSQKKFASRREGGSYFDMIYKRTA